MSFDADQLTNLTIRTLFLSLLLTTGAQVVREQGRVGEVQDGFRVRPIQALG